MTTTATITRTQRSHLIEEAVGHYQDDRDAMAELGSVSGIRHWLRSMDDEELLALLRGNGWHR